MDINTTAPKCLESYSPIEMNSLMVEISRTKNGKIKLKFQGIPNFSRKTYFTFLHT